MEGMRRSDDRVNPDHERLEFEITQEQIEIDRNKMSLDLLHVDVDDFLE